MRLRSAILIRSLSEPPAMRMASGTTKPSHPNPPIIIIASATIPATMNPTPRTNDAPDEPGSTRSSQLQRLVARRRRDVHRAPGAGSDERVLELPHPRFRREPRLGLVGRGGHGRQRRRRGVARRVHELSGSRPLTGRPLPRLLEAAGGPVSLAGRRDQPAPGPCGPRASRTARRTSPATAVQAGLGGGGAAGSWDGSLGGWSGCWLTVSRCAMSGNGATALVTTSQLPAPARRRAADGPHAAADHRLAMRCPDTYGRML